MPLRPPRDFAPPTQPRASPGEAELRALWRRHEAERRRREREREWGRVQEDARRERGGELVPSAAARSLPPYLEETEAIGPRARAALRPVPRNGRVLATGVDTWSPCWYAEPGLPLARAMRALASEQARRAWMLPDPVLGHRVGWFPDAGLVFAEGRAGAEALVAAAELPAALERLGAALADLGIPIAAPACAGLRRLDIAADLRTDSAVEGRALLECVGVVSPGAEVLCAYRAERGVQSVLMKSRAGRTLARLYDKGAQSGRAPPGRWLRLEAQWRFPRQARPALEQVDSAVLRERFARRFASLWQAAGGFRLGGAEAIVESLAAAVEAGQLAPSRARTLAGYLLLGAAGIPQGARRTTCELERECRQLGLSASLLDAPERRVDVATVLDECLAPALWR
ncbi:MAG TPA: hypothetical protein VNM89_06600 [Solirubrobacterales bacterium]|nr:hypothetical protein [Solirubrobacterales bacterium]